MIRQLYWISIYIILIISGTLFLDRVAEHSGAHNLFHHISEALQWNQT